MGYHMENNENKAVCKTCGGVCCKNMGCHLHPSDVFKDGIATAEAVRDLLLTENYSIDWWEGDPRNIDYDDPTYVDRGYYIRARHVGAPVVDPSFGGVCVMLTPTGCKLSFEDRPLGGKSLIPKSTATGRCVSSFTKQDAALAWIPYHEQLMKGLELYYDAK